jgi:hypothetical protein
VTAGADSGITETGSQTRQARAPRVGSLPEAAGSGQGVMIPVPWSTLPQAPEQAACRIAPPA